TCAGSTGRASTGRPSASPSARPTTCSSWNRVPRGRPTGAGSPTRSAAAISTGSISRSSGSPAPSRRPASARCWSARRSPSPKRSSSPCAPTCPAVDRHRSIDGREFEMPSFLRMPSPAAGVEEATLLEWSVDDHAAFALSDVLLVIETDKAVIDVEAESAGVLHRKLVGAGQSVPVGTPLAAIGEAGDSEADIEALAAEAGANSAPAAAASEPVPAETAGSPSGGKHGYDAAAVPAPSATP